MKLRIPTVWRAWLGASAALALWFGGCDADPMPSPGSVNRTKVVLSASRLSNAGVAQVGIIGLPLATSAAGFVVVRGPMGMSEAPATAGGTFAGLAPGSAGDTLELTFKLTETGAEGPAVALTVPTPNGTTNSATSGSVDNNPAPPVAGVDAGIVVGADGGSIPAVDGGGAGQAPDGGGSDISDAGAGTTPGQDAGTTAATAPAPTLTVGPVVGGQSEIAGSGFVAADSVVIGDEVSGAVVDATVASDGTIQASLPAQTGDSIVVVVQDPAGVTSVSAVFTVP